MMLTKLMMLPSIYHPFTIHLPSIYHPFCRTLPLQLPHFASPSDACRAWPPMTDGIDATALGTVHFAVAAVQAHPMGWLYNRGLS